MNHVINTTRDWHSW